MRATKMDPTTSSRLAHTISQRLFQFTVMIRFQNAARAAPVFVLCTRESYEQSLQGPWIVSVIIPHVQAAAGRATTSSPHQLRRDTSWSPPPRDADNKISRPPPGAAPASPTAAGPKCRWRRTPSAASSGGSSLCCSPAPGAARWCRRPAGPRSRRRPRTRRPPTPRCSPPGGCAGSRGSPRSSCAGTPGAAPPPAAAGRRRRGSPAPRRCRGDPRCAPGQEEKNGTNEAFHEKCQRGILKLVNIFLTPSTTTVENFSCEGENTVIFTSSAPGCPPACPP